MRWVHNWIHLEQWLGLEPSMAKLLVVLASLSWIWKPCFVCLALCARSPHAFVNSPYIRCDAFNITESKYWQNYKFTFFGLWSKYSDMKILIMCIVFYRWLQACLWKTLAWNFHCWHAIEWSLEFNGHWSKQDITTWFWFVFSSQVLHES